MTAFLDAPQTAPRIVSVQIGRPGMHVSCLEDGQDAEWVSSIWKAPVAGRLRLGRTDLAGNGQADLKNHGGPDKAVCCYAAEHYPEWRSWLSKSDEEFGCGAFGENFTLAGLTEETVCVGDIYNVGAAVVQVSQPRMPCWKVGRRWERPEMPLEMTASGRTGFYLRVLAEGEVGAGDALSLAERPSPEWTVARVNEALYIRKDDAALAGQLAHLPTLAEAWRRQFRRRTGLLRSQSAQSKIT